MGEGVLRVKRLCYLVRKRAIPTVFTRVLHGGRAAAEWPELGSGRRLVELFLVWKTFSGNLERRFRRFRETRCPQRAQLLDVSVENCVVVEQAPSSQNTAHVAVVVFGCSRDEA